MFVRDICIKNIIIYNILYNYIKQFGLYETSMELVVSYFHEYIEVLENISDNF